MQKNSSAVTQATSNRDFHISPPDGSDTPQTRAVIQLVKDRYHATLQDRQNRIAQIQKLVDNWKEEVIKRVGSAHWKRFAEFSRAQRSSNYGLGDLGSDPDGANKVAAAKRAARKQSLLLMRDAGVNPDEIKAIHRRFGEDYLRVSSSNPPHVKLMSEGEVASSGSEQSGAALYSQKPPYQAVPVDVYPYDEYTYGEITSLTAYSDPNIGDVGHQSTYKDYDAGDFDWFELWVKTGIAFWFKPTSTGRLAITVKGRCSKASYSVRLTDDWGWSDSTTNLVSDVLVNVTSDSNEAVSVQCWKPLVFTGAPTDHTYAGDVVPAGSLKDFVATTPQTIAANVNTYITIELENYHRSILNDVDSSQTMYNRWVFQEVTVQTIV